MTVSPHLTGIPCKAAHSPGSTPVHEHEIFPVYHLYFNGVRLDQHLNRISRAIMEQFIQLGDNP